MLCLELKNLIECGLLYTRIADKEISVLIPGIISSTILEALERFRGEAYGKVPAVVDGRDIRCSDANAYHVLMINKTGIIGSARYLRGPVVQLGGFVIRRDFRGSTVVLKIIAKIKELASHLGDSIFHANASIEFGSASILRRLGGKVIKTYFDESYQRNVELIEFRLDPHAHA